MEPRLDGSSKLALLESTGNREMSAVIETEQHHLRVATRRSEPRISAIVVNYNGVEVLDGCISTLIGQTYPPEEIVVVDNGSTDSSVKLLRENFPEVKIVGCPKNVGYAEANNIGARLASGEVLLFVNNDTLLDARCLQELVQSFNQDADLAVVQGKVLRYRQPAIIDSVGSFLTPYGFLYHIGHGMPDSYATESYVFTAKGVCMMVLKNLFHKLGEFDTDYVSYFEESDFCWRAWIGGFKVKFIPSSIVYHIGGFTSERFPKAFLDYHSFKNRICSLIKNCEPKTLFFMLPLHLSFCFLIMMGLATRNQGERSLGIVKAFVWNVRNLPTTLRKRRLIQSKLRRLSDKEAFGDFLIQPGTDNFLEMFRSYTTRS